MTKTISIQTEVEIEFCDIARFLQECDDPLFKFCTLLHSVKSISKSDLEKLTGLNDLCTVKGDVDRRCFDFIKSILDQEYKDVVE